MADSNIDMMRPSASAPLATEGLGRRVETQFVRVGNSGNLGESLRDKLYGYDWREGISGKMLPCEVSQPDKFSMEQVRLTLQRIHRAYGVHEQSEAFVAAFDFAFFYYWGMQGFSVLTPTDNAIITVSGSEFNMQRACELMGPIPRRFGRGAADLVVDALRTAYNDGLRPDASLDQLVRYHRLLAYAHDRKCTKYPWCASEVAGDSITLTADELSYAKRASNQYLEGTTNNVDKSDNGHILFTKDDRNANSSQYTI